MKRKEEDGTNGPGVLYVARSLMGGEGTVSPSSRGILILSLSRHLMRLLHARTLSLHSGCVLDEASGQCVQDTFS